MAKDRQVPTRTCIATGVQKPKSQMIRLVRLEDDTVVVDPSGKARGRGANLDSTLEAFELAISKNAISRALKLERKLSDSEISELREQFSQLVESKNFRQGRRKVTIRVSHEDYLKSKSED